MHERRNFTEQERHIIDGAYKKLSNNEDISVNEFRLVLEFEKDMALWQDDRIAEQTRLDAKAAADIENSELKAKAAADALKALSDAMVENYLKTCAVPEV